MTPGTAPPLMSFGDMARWFLRWSWLMILGGVAGVLLASWFTPAQQSYSATSRVGLTDQVVWPFFDATRQRVAGRADDLDPSVALAGIVDEQVTIDVSLPTSETYINIRATAPTPETAVLAANTIAEQLVAGDASNETSSVFRPVLVELEQNISELETRIATMDRGYEELLLQQVEAEARWIVLRFDDEQPQSVLEEALGTKTLLDSEVLSARSRRDSELRRLSAFRIELDRLLLDVESEQIGPDVELLRSAVSQELTASPLRARQVIGGLTGITVAAMAIWVLDRSLGRVRSAAALRSTTGLPVIDATSERGIGQLALWATQLDAHEAVGFVGDPEQLGDLLRDASPLWLKPTLVVSATDPLLLSPEERRSKLILVLLGDPSRGHTFDRAIAACDTSVLVVGRGQSRPASIQRTISDVAALGADVGVVAFVAPRRRGRQKADNRAPAMAAQA
ncbi:MAG: hypothetical protein ACRBK7_13870 [Acidimicrobiales bacterium]